MTRDATIERVASAILETMHDGLPRTALQKADAYAYAAIEAMRQPTDGAVDRADLVAVAVGAMLRALDSFDPPLRDGGVVVVAAAMVIGRELSACSEVDRERWLRTVCEVVRRVEVVLLQ